MKAVYASLLLLVTAIGCHSSSTSPPEEQPSDKYPRLPDSAQRRIGVHLSPDAVRRLSMQRAQAGAFAAPPASTASLDNYAAFSNDGLLFAWALSGSPGGSVLHFIAVTTGTEEKTVPLDTPAHRQEASSALTEAGLPPPGTPSDKARPLGAEVKDGRVVLTFGGVPASKTYEPFGGAAKVDKVAVIATTKDGKHAAVRIEGTPVKGQGSVVEYHVFPLFG
jgi:hypothetical protein